MFEGAMLDMVLFVAGTWILVCIGAGFYIARNNRAAREARAREKKPPQ